MFTMYFLWGFALLFITVASENTTTINSTHSTLENTTSTSTQRSTNNFTTVTLNDDVSLDLDFNVSNQTSIVNDSYEQTLNVTFSDTNEFRLNTTNATSIDSRDISESANSSSTSVTLNTTVNAESIDTIEEQNSTVVVETVTELSSAKTITLEISQNATQIDVTTTSHEKTSTTAVDTTMFTSTDANMAVSSSESNDMPGYIWFVLILDGNCSINDNDLENLRDRVEEGVTHWFEIDRRDLTIQNTLCSSPDQMLVNITMFRKPGTNVSALLTSLEDLGRPLVRVKNHDYYVYKILTIDGYINKEPDIDVDMKHSDVELVIYIAVGSCCAFMILLIVGLLLCKYCDCREPKQFDFGEAPNINMRLEDYTLTRIPRPKLGYVDYYRGLSKRYSPLDDKIVTSPNGMVQPFDTSVVPLEDAYVQDAAALRPAPCSTFRDYRDGIIVRPSDINRFGHSLSKIYRSGRGKIIGKRTLTTDGDGYDTRSTENLHKSHNEDRFMDRGLDNPVFH